MSSRIALRSQHSSAWPPSFVLTALVLLSPLLQSALAAAAWYPLGMSFQRSQATQSASHAVLVDDIEAARALRNFFRAALAMGNISLAGKAFVFGSLFHLHLSIPPYSV